MTPSERLLVLVLRAASAVLLLALVPAAMPFAWMDAVHRWLGLGELPQQPVMEYLCRSASLLYAYHGAVLLFVSFDVRRWMPVLRCLAWLGVAFGAAVAVVDLAARLPPWWIVGDAASILAICGVILWLAGRCEQERP